ncbi:MAG: hypothetical protein JO270_13255 [Acidobacteriaceae bacterium]|nr:hypothetical protein [Acidobacteriaceae bacterium]
MRDNGGSAGARADASRLIALHLFVVLDLAFTSTHHASILALYRSYVAERDAAHRAVYLAASEYGSSIYSTQLLTFTISPFHHWACCWRVSP